MPLAMRSYAVVGRAEVLSPTDFWLRVAAGTDVTDAWLCCRSYDTETRIIRPLDTPLTLVTGRVRVL